MNKTNYLGTKKAGKITKAFGVIGTAVVMTFMTSLPAYAVTINQNLTTEKLIGGIIDFIIKVAFYMGFVIVAAGIFMLILAFKDENAEGQSRAARFCVVGAIMIGLKLILLLTGLVL